MVGLTCRVGAHNSRHAHDTRLYPTSEQASYGRNAKPSKFRLTCNFQRLSVAACMVGITMIIRMGHEKRNCRTYVRAWQHQLREKARRATLRLLQHVENERQIN